MSKNLTSEIERLRREVPIVELVTALGVLLTEVEGKQRGHCPLHEDAGTSLEVDPQANTWRCASCNVDGSVIEWVMRTQKVSCKHAVQVLATGLRPGPRERGYGKSRPVLPSEFTEDLSEQELTNRVMALYRRTFYAQPQARAFLKRRGLDDPELIEHFQLGYANGTLPYQLPDKKQIGGKVVRGTLQRLGLFRLVSGREHLDGSLVVPIFDGQGRVVQAYGRKVTANLHGGSGKHLFLNCPPRGVFNLAGLAGAEEVIVCDSILDALTFWKAGFRHVTAVVAASWIAPDLLDALLAADVRRVIVAFRPENSVLAEQLAETLARMTFHCHRLRYPVGRDANDVARRSAQPADALGELIDAARGRPTDPPPGGSHPEATGSVLIDASEGVADALADPPPASEASVREAPPVEVDEAAEVAPSLASEVHSAQVLSVDVDDSVEAESVAEPTPGPAPPTSAPAPPSTGTSVEERPHEFVVTLSDRRYRIRGLEKNLSHESLRINLLVERAGLCHVDTLDLYLAKHRAAFERQAAVELGVKDSVLHLDLGKLLRELEDRQHALIQDALAPKSPIPTMTDAEHEAALDLLRDPRLLDRVVADFEACGVVGEETNKLVCYLACVSRLLVRPLALLVQSNSGAGKSALMEAVLAMMPSEAFAHYSAMTGQSLYYLDGSALQHKILAIAEDQGAEQAAYALKLLQSEGALSIASTGKDPQTGKLVTQTYSVLGPVMLFLTTTAAELDEELLNRCLVLTVNESREQTQAILAHQRSRRTLTGFLAADDRKDLLALHHNAQRLLEPLAVVIPDALRLSFDDSKTRMRRDHLKYLTLIQAIALLHQHQRPVKTVERRGRTLEFVEVIPADVVLANRLAGEVLGRSLDDLPPQTRRLLGDLHAVVAGLAKAQGVAPKAVRFTRREAREAIGWRDTQLRVHLKRLVDLEYLLVHRGAKGLKFVYELAWRGEGEDGAPFLAGLVDAQALLPAAGGTTRAQVTDLAGAAGAGRGDVAAPSRGDDPHATAGRATRNPKTSRPRAKRTSPAGKKPPSSDRRRTDTPPAPSAAGEKRS